MGKVSAFWQVFYSKWSTPISPAGTRITLPAYFSLLYLTATKPVTPLRSEAVNLYSHIFLVLFGELGVLSFPVEGQENIRLSYLSALRREDNVYLVFKMVV